VLGVVAGTAAIGLTRPRLEQPPDMVLMPAAASYTVGNFDAAKCWLQADASWKLSKQHLMPWFKELAKQSGQPLSDVEDVAYSQMNGTAQQLARLTPRTVAIRAFYIDRCEVSNADYARYLIQNQSALAPATWEGRSAPAGQEKQPVRGISYEEAQAYTKSRNRRLPTYVEWQYAAAAGKQQFWPWGNEVVRDKANTLIYWEASKNPELLPVDDPGDRNELGLFHFGGNVAEWARGPENSSVACGGHFQSDILQAMTFSRQEVPPTTRDPLVGFRCAKDYQTPQEVAMGVLWLIIVGVVLIAAGIVLLFMARKRGDSLSG